MAAPFLLCMVGDKKHQPSSRFSCHDRIVLQLQFDLKRLGAVVAHNGIGLIVEGF